MFSKQKTKILLAFLMFSIYAGLINLNYRGSYEWILINQPNVSICLAILIFVLSAVIQIRSSRVETKTIIGYSLVFYLILTFMFLISFYETVYGRFGPYQESFGEVIGIPSLTSNGTLDCLPILPAGNQSTSYSDYKCSWIESLQINPRDNLLVLMIYVILFPVSLLLALIPAGIIFWTQKTMRSGNPFNKVFSG